MSVLHKMSDLEGMMKLKLKVLECEDPERRSMYIRKLEKLKTWEHPRVTEKLAELRQKNVITR